MGLEVQQSNPGDLDAIADLLTTAFQVPRDSYFAARELLKWKYFDAGPDWTGSRSYVIRRGGTIEAHCAVWPLKMSHAGEVVSGICFVDWASGKSLPGAGIL